MSNRAQESAERIRTEIPILKVLSDYGYAVRIDGGNRAQQFPCDLHGDGRDGKASGRVYPETGQFFCFACGRSRDAVTLVREKEGVSFWDAVKKLEKEYGLQPLPWDGPEENPGPTLTQEIENSLTKRESPEQALHRIERFLQGLTTERSLPPQKCASLWEAYDRTRLFAEEGGQESEVLEMARKVLSAAKQAVKSGPQESGA